jgi:hypothetical protein
MIRPRLRSPLVIVLAGCVATAAAAAAAAAFTHSPAITEQEALQTFAALQDVVAAEKGRPDPASFCAEFASNQTMCAWSLDQADEAYPIGEVEPRGVQLLPDGTAVIRVEGELSDRSAYSGFIQVVREGGSTVAADPVYWVTREFTESRTAQPSPVD